jgi:hypothetical protein
MTSRGWPRQDSEDPLLPDHIVPRRTLDHDPLPERDRRAFRLIRAGADRAFVVSRSRRSAAGSVLTESPLLGGGPATRILSRARVPEHAFSEADRLLARGDDAERVPRLATAYACWLSWRRPEITPHDGRVRANHRVVLKALTMIHSPTSLRMMLRDPLGFVWRYALGWESAIEEEQPLTLSAKSSGELVHELLRRTVESLEPTPGLARAAEHEIEMAIRSSTSTS